MDLGFDKRRRLEVIQKIRLLTVVKGCRSLTGMVNFQSIFCPDLQKLLRPIWFNKKRQPIYVGRRTTDSFWGNKILVSKATSSKSAR